MLEAIAKKIRRSVPVRGSVIAADFIVTLTLNFLLILLALQKIAGCRRVVILTEGGFGHTITAPDIARRIFPDKKPLVIIFSTMGRHNWSLSKVWTDIDVIHLWKYLYYYSKSQSTRMSMLALWVLRSALRKQIYLVTADPELKDASRRGAWTERITMYQMFINQQIERYGAISQPYYPGTEYMLYWVRDVFLNPMPQPMLPLQIDKHFMQKMEHIHPHRTGVLAVYMRRKGEAADSLTRCGGTYEDYRPIFEAAHKRGLLVLVLGDRPLEDCPPDMRAYLRDARSFNLDNEWYSLAAIIKCNYFVGDPGGGSLLPCLLQMQKIMVNSFPYSQAWPGYLLLFKRLKDSEGRCVSLARCFNEYPWTYDWGSEYVLMNNNSSELAAVMDEMFRVPASDWRDYIAKSNFESMGTYTRQGARVCEVQYMND